MAAMLEALISLMYARLRFMHLNIEIKNGVSI